MNRGVKPSKANGTGNPYRGIEIAEARGIWLEDRTYRKGVFPRESHARPRTLALASVFLLKLLYFPPAINRALYFD
jgi:hypothetical protein